MPSPIENAIFVDSSQPDCYMFKCALCPKKLFTLRLDAAKKFQATHEEETGHNVSFIRRPIKTV